MEIEGRAVGRALSAVIKPALRERGFDRFQGRHAWRRSEFTVDLISFPSMNSYTADGVGCTSFSFGCEAGVYYPALAGTEPIAWPRGYDLTFRGFPVKTIRQPIFHPWGVVPTGADEWRRDRADVWYVLEDGSNLEEVVDDARRAAIEQALPFIDHHDDPTNAMQALQEPVGRNADFGVMGVHSAARDSPGNRQLIADLAALIGAR